MAPRKRTKKFQNQNGGTRMDVAVDVMSEFGFSPQLVRNSVNHLLQVYGDHWVFIERDSYKVLIDYILDENMESDEPKAIMAAEEKPSSSKAIVKADCDVEYDDDEILFLRAEPWNTAFEKISKGGFEAAFIHRSS